MKKLFSAVLFLIILLGLLMITMNSKQWEGNRIIPSVNRTEVSWNSFFYNIAFFYGLSLGAYILMKSFFRKRKKEGEEDNREKVINPEFSGVEEEIQNIHSLIEDAHKSTRK